jgi:hypothetical protein
VSEKYLLPGVVAYDCNSSYSEGKEQKNWFEVSRSKKLVRPPSQEKWWELEKRLDQEELT